VPAKSGIGIDVGDATVGVGISVPHEQAITTIVTTKDKTAINTFLLGFMAFSFEKSRGLFDLIV
jgi:RNase H-fold protein (predicted Holliday junction resolvase)